MVEMFRATRPVLVDEAAVLWTAKRLGLVNEQGQTEVSAGLPVLGVKRRVKEARPFSASDPRDLELLVHALRDAGELSGLRPGLRELEVAYDDWRDLPIAFGEGDDRQLIFEATEATPIRVEYDDGEPRVIWVLGSSEADPSTRYPVVLTQNMPSEPMSGVSGLLWRYGLKQRGSRARSLVRWVRGTDAASLVRRLDEGPNQPATPGRSRRVLALYQLVKGAALEGSTAPVPCLLGYPHFIVEEPAL